MLRNEGDVLDTITNVLRFSSNNLEVVRRHGKPEPDMTALPLCEYFWQNKKGRESQANV